jgi:inward rectifier potassium channel
MNAINKRACDTEPDDICTTGSRRFPDTVFIGVERHPIARPMKKPSFDPGLTQQVTGNLTRAIDKDGGFNVEREGGSWRYIHPYLHLINIGWPSFLGIVTAAYLAINIVFAIVYYSLGPGQLIGGDASVDGSRFITAFFFSAHTLTTVGYGNIAPGTVAANSVAAIEAMVGLMGFALATGVLFGRVSRPSAKIGFSENVLVTPYEEGTSLQFRIVNLRPNVLIELSANIMLMTIEDGQRKFVNLTLERDKIYFFPLTWTVVHPIDDSSPLLGKTAAELEALHAEVLILIKGFDDTFSQTVNARYSYRYDEMIWGAKFAPAFHIDEEGKMVLELGDLSKFQNL